MSGSDLDYNLQRIVCLTQPTFQRIHAPTQNWILGVPVVVKGLTNPTRNYEVVGSIPGLAQWVKDPALP